MSKRYIRFPNFKRKAITLSYDDGIRQDKRLIAIMQKYGLKGTFNINSGLFGSEYTGKEVGRMTKEEAYELYTSSQMEVAIHGYKHLHPALVENDLMVNEICTDRKELEGMFRKIIKGMAYAYGAYNDDVVEILKKCGVQYARTTISTEKFDLPSDWLRLPATCHHNNPKLMKLAKTFIEQQESGYFWNNAPQLFYLWGHSYEFDNNDNWNVIEEFASYVGGRDDIWYATNGEIYAYVQACDRLEFSIDGNTIYNPSYIDVYITYMGKNLIIPAGETIKI